MDQPNLTYHEELIVSFAAEAFKEMKAAEKKFRDAEWAYAHIERSMKDFPHMIYWLERRNRHYDDKTVFD